MGVDLFKSTDIYSSRWINAEIDDATDRTFVVWVRHVLGGYFLADIEGRLYAFELGKVKTIKHTTTKTYKIIRYDTTHYKPIDTEKLKLLEQIVMKNSLPKIDKKMWDVLSILGRREKNLKPGEIFKGHKLNDVIAEIEKESLHNPERAKNLRTFVQELSNDTIVTPVRKLMEFLDVDIKLTDPKFLGDVLTQHLRTEEENRIMANRPQVGKKSIAKLVLVILVAGLAIGLGVWALTVGPLANGINMFQSTSSSGTGNVLLHVKDIQAQYPEPIDVVNAVHSGKLTCANLDAELKHLVNNPPGKAGTCP